MLKLLPSFSQTRLVNSVNLDLPDSQPLTFLCLTLGLKRVICCTLKQQTTVASNFRSGHEVGLLSCFVCRSYTNSSVEQSRESASLLCVRYAGMGFGIPKAPQDFIVGQRETFLMLLGVRPEQSTLNLEQRVLFTQYRLIKNGFECSLHTVSYIFPLFISQVYFSRFHNDLFSFVNKNCAQIITSAYLSNSHFKTY